MIRTLRFGHGLLLLRSARPIMLTLHPWIDRKDADTIKTDRTHLEQMIRRSAEEHLAA